MTFYISQFWCGVIAAVVVEFGAIVGIAVISAVGKDKKKGEKDVEEAIDSLVGTCDARGQWNDSTGENH